jgi:hypothetical protein
VEAIKLGLGSILETVNARLAVGWKSCWPEKLGELSGGAPTQGIHLEETILCVNKTGSISDIFSVLAANRGNAQRITLHCHWTFQSGDRKNAVQSRQACRERTPNQAQESHHQKEKQEQHSEENLSAHGLFAFPSRPLKNFGQVLTLLFYRAYIRIGTSGQTI